MRRFLMRIFHYLKKKLKMKERKKSETLIHKMWIKRRFFIPLHRILLVAIALYGRALSSQQSSIWHILSGRGDKL